MEVPVVFASLVSDGLLCSLSLHRSRVVLLALQDATNSAECEMTLFSLLQHTHINRYTKLPLNTHLPMQPQNELLAWILQGGSTASTSYASQTSSQCTSETFREFVSAGVLYCVSLTQFCWMFIELFKWKNTVVQIWSVTK